MHKRNRRIVSFWLSIIVVSGLLTATLISVRIVSPFSNGENERRNVVINEAENVLYSLLYGYEEGRIDDVISSLNHDNSSLNLWFSLDGVMLFTNTSEKQGGAVVWATIQDGDTTNRGTLTYSLRTELGTDTIQVRFSEIDLVLQYREVLYGLTVLGVLWFLIAFIRFINIIGVREDGTYIITVVDRIPIEVLFCFAWWMLAEMFDVIRYYEYYDRWKFLYTIALLFIARSVFVRMKARIMFKHSLIRMSIDFYHFSAHNHMGLSAGIIGGIVFTFIFMVLFGFGGFIILLPYWVMIGIALYCFIHYRNEVEVIRRLSADIKEGNYYQRFNGVNAAALNEIGTNLTTIQSGLTIAVDKQLKSEKTKSELITNVSHDLKTPLTSIVNYVDLLKHESLTETQSEYLAVLDKQVTRLRKLTDDLFDAAKINTMDVDLVREPINLKTVWEQSLAEYEEQILEKQLHFITALDDVDVLADGQYLWRVIDNVLRNSVSYSLDKTRIYVDTVVNDATVDLSIKNISMHPLNMSEEALMDRFVRGDSSRNTEGSGLGLSIARSIVKMLQGDFKIYIDGDLFKVVISLPLVKA